MANNSTPNWDHRWVAACIENASAEADHAGEMIKRYHAANTVSKDPYWLNIAVENLRFIVYWLHRAISGRYTNIPRP